MIQQHNSVYKHVISVKFLRPHQLRTERYNHADGSPFYFVKESVYFFKDRSVSSHYFIV